MEENTETSYEHGDHGHRTQTNPCLLPRRSLMGLPPRQRWRPARRFRLVMAHPPTITLGRWQSTPRHRRRLAGWPVHQHCPVAQPFPAPQTVGPPRLPGGRRLVAQPLLAPQPMLIPPAQFYPSKYQKDHEPRAPKGNHNRRSRRTEVGKQRQTNHKHRHMNQNRQEFPDLLLMSPIHRFPPGQMERLCRERSRIVRCGPRGFLPVSYRHQLSPFSLLWVQ